VLENLLRKMMRVVLENAGAQKGFLILEKEDALVIEAEGAVDTGEITVLQSRPVASALPASILNYVSHSHERVVLSNAAHEGQFTNDPYVLEHLPKSLLCLPLLNQGKLTGILYLENNLTTDAFSQNHLEILNLLSSQMAISIENAGLYQDVQDAARQLEEYNRTLEQKVDERTRELDQKNIRLNETLGEVEKAHRNITDSIEYAKRIQSSMLPSPDVLKACLPQSFVIWRPRDIVGGDFFYVDASEHGIIVSVVDCTGHGVPGAFMTMIASSGLRRITGTERCHDPAEILKRLNFIVKTSLQQNTEHALSDDGLDAGICLLQTDRLIFAGAKLPLICVHKEELRVIKGDRQSIGYKKSDLNFDFSNHMLDIEPGMAFYMASDGFEDQLGGKKHFPFGKKRFRNLLRENAGKPFEEQERLLSEAFDAYKRGNDRQDDVTIMGFSL
jgi:serine phosphatase RsbU (regulator of sigma subunit)